MHFVLKLVTSFISLSKRSLQLLKWLECEPRLPFRKSNPLPGVPPSVMDAQARGVPFILSGASGSVFRSFPNKTGMSKYTDKYHYSACKFDWKAHLMKLLGDMLKASYMFQHFDLGLDCSTVSKRFLWCMAMWPASRTFRSASLQMTV